jgi:hypothetical protein
MAYRAPANTGMPCRFDRQVKALESLRALEGSAAGI